MYHTIGWVLDRLGYTTVLNVVFSAQKKVEKITTKTSLYLSPPVSFQQIIHSFFSSVTKRRKETRTPLIIQLYFLSEDCSGELHFLNLFYFHTPQNPFQRVQLPATKTKNPVPGKKPFCPRPFDAAFNLKFIKYENEPKENSSAHPGSFSRSIFLEV